MVGDALIHSQIIKYAYDGAGYNFDRIFEDIKPELKGDLIYYNAETILGGKEQKYSGYPNFNTPDEFGDTMLKLGFNLVSRANNHTLDKGEKAILHACDYWNSKDVITSGSACSYEESYPKVYELNNITFTFLSYTTLTNGYMSPNDYYVNVFSEDKYLDDLKKLNNKPDIIIVAMHFGDEYKSMPTTRQREISKFLSENGANIIIGTHPHVIEPIEWINNTLVIYSLGNFVSSQNKSNEYERLIGMLLKVDIIKNDGKIQILTPRTKLLYTYYKNNSNYKVIPFNKLNDNILYNYNYYKDKYNNLIKTYTQNIITE